jgi:hypothetical protein
MITLDAVTTPSCVLISTVFRSGRTRVTGECSKTRAPRATAARARPSVAFVRIHARIAMRHERNAAHAGPAKESVPLERGDLQSRFAPRLILLLEPRNPFGG